LVIVGCFYQHKPCRSGMSENFFMQLCVIGRCSLNITNANKRPDIIFYLTESFVFPFVRLLYRTPPPNVGKYAAPDLICFDTTVCEIPAPSNNEHESVVFDTYECYRHFQYINHPPPLHSITQLVLLVQSIFSGCTFSLAHQLSSDSLYVCKSGLKISSNRKQDGYKDCSSSVWYGDEDERGYAHPTKCAIDRFDCHSLESTGMIDIHVAMKFICVHRRFLNDRVDDCAQNKADEIVPVSCTNEIDCQYMRHIDFSGTTRLFLGFQDLCDGYTYISK
jgi:hypothetical protein